MPQNAAGMRHDPPVSVPSATAAMPSATETAAPLLLPPGTRPPPSPVPRSHGAFGVPWCGLMPMPENANSDMLVRPTGTKPAASMRCTTGAWASAGAASDRMALPAAVTSPRTSSKSFRLTGTPA